MFQPNAGCLLENDPYFGSKALRIITAVRGAFMVVAAIVMLPLAFAFVQTPLQFSDVLTGPRMFYSPKDDFTSAKEILPNYAHALVRSTHLVRPTQVLVNNLQYVLFGPEPGAMYAVKWAMKFASVFFVLAALRRLGVDALSCFAAGALVLFHPICLDPLLWSADGQAAFLLAAMLALSLRFAENGEILRIDRLAPWRYFALFAVWFLLLGAKEVCFVFCGCFVLVWQTAAIKSGRAWLRLSPFYSVLAFWTYRLAGAGRVSTENGLKLSDVGMRAGELLQKICPPSPYGALSWVCLLLIGLAVVKAFRCSDRRMRWSVAFFIAALAGGVLFLAIPQVRPSARYVIALTYLFVLLVGVGMSQLPQAIWPLKACFVLLMPAWMAGDLYSQTLSFVQDMYEYNEALNYLEAGAMRGYGIACSGLLSEKNGSFEREAQETVKCYFERYGAQFYDLQQPAHVSLLNDGDRPNGPYYLMTSFSPEQLESTTIPGLDLNKISGVVVIERKRRGLLAKMQKAYVRLADWLGNDHMPPYDLGTVGLSDISRYFIYTVDGAPRTNSGPLPLARVRPTYHPGAFIR